jgi:D-amino-acid dehydrogenase
LRAVATASGDVACDKAVIAAGIGSKMLAAQAGDRVFLESERGYHAVLADPGFELPVPVMPADGKMGNTSTLHGLRLAGQVELASEHSPPDWRRADILVGHALRAYPPLREGARATVAKRWMGHRPSTPDGLPVLGMASGCADVVHAFGHGHVGLARIVGLVASRWCGADDWWQPRERVPWNAGGCVAGALGGGLAAAVVGLGFWRCVCGIECAGRPGRLVG